MEDVIKTARDLYACDDIQIDDGAALSETDSGTWVAAWVWVSKEAPDAAPLPDAA